MDETYQIWREWRWEPKKWSLGLGIVFSIVAHRFGFNYISGFDFNYLSMCTAIHGLGLDLWVGFLWLYYWFMASVLVTFVHGGISYASCRLVTRYVPNALPNLRNSVWTWTSCLATMVCTRATCYPLNDKILSYAAVRLAVVWLHVTSFLVRRIQTILFLLIWVGQFHAEMFSD